MYHVKRPVNAIHALLERLTAKHHRPRTIAETPGIFTQKMLWEMTYRFIVRQNNPQTQTQTKHSKIFDLTISQFFKTLVGRAF